MSKVIHFSRIRSESIARAKSFLVDNLNATSETYNIQITDRLTSLDSGSAYILRWHNGDIAGVSTMPVLDGHDIRHYPSVIDKRLKKHGLECFVQPLGPVFAASYLDHGDKPFSMDATLQPEIWTILKKFGFKATSQRGCFKFLRQNTSKCADAILPFVGRQLGFTEGDLGSAKIILRDTGPMLRADNKAAIASLAFEQLDATQDCLNGNVKLIDRGSLTESEFCDE